MIPKASTQTSPTARTPSQFIHPHVFCGTGDHLWNHHVEPVDSPAAIDALCQWLSGTYGSRRLYWRGGQDQIWLENFQQDGFDPLVEEWIAWKHHLIRTHDLNRQAVEIARRQGMETFLYTGLFEHGLQPDVGVIHPYLFEDNLRIRHPEWCPLDRWRQRRAPGPICFSHPEARKAVIDRLMRHLRDFGYRGVNFYTYVENVGLRYEDEFGFNPPVAAAFQNRHPSTDFPPAVLTPEEDADWQLCRGQFVTEFLRELHERMAAENLLLSISLDAQEPGYPQRWWGKHLHGTGKFRLEWERWIEEGLVDEVWVQLGELEDQQRLLGDLVRKCQGKPVKLTVRTADPFAPHWQPFLQQGVTPIAVITLARNGIERLSLRPTSLETLGSPDWKLRAQTLCDIGVGALVASSADVLPLAADAEILVRHRLTHALAKVGGSSAIALLEQMLNDPEPCVRTAAAAALAATHGPASADQIFRALETTSFFPFKKACAEALQAIGVSSLPLLVRHTESASADAREVSIRALGSLLPVSGHRQIGQRLSHILFNPDEETSLRLWALRALLQCGESLLPVFHESQTALTGPLIALLQNEGTAETHLPLQAAMALQHLAPFLDRSEKTEALEILLRLFASYGDMSTRRDAAYGWRVIGNAIVALGGADHLDVMRQQTGDRWLAWCAYEVSSLVQTTQGKDDSYEFNEVTTENAIETHARFAPAFPGWRTWEGTSCPERSGLLRPAI